MDVNRVPKPFLNFDDPGASDDEPVRGVTVGDIRAWPAVSSKLIRRFEDGTVEIELADGRRCRQVPKPCLSCGRGTISHAFKNFKLMQSGLCNDCFKVEETERALALVRQRAMRRQTPAERRYIALVLATPLWRDRIEIEKIYKEAQRLTIENDKLYEVDHIYPIQCKFACGLHVHHNLQILEKGHNRSKKNKFPLFDSPALRS